MTEQAALWDEPMNPVLPALPQTWSVGEGLETVVNAYSAPDSNSRSKLVIEHGLQMIQLRLSSLA